MLEFTLLAFVSLLIGTGAIWMALIEPIPINWLYWHYFSRQWLVWLIFLGTLVWGLVQPAFPLWLIGPLLVMALGIVLAYRMHQSVVFHAIDKPPQAEADELPLSDDMELAVIEHAGTIRAYALDHLIHHHVINDRFGDRIVALTYCAMCRSIIPFDVTEIGPLFVGSYKHANMVLADRATSTFFQQASFKSIMGKRHSMELTMIPYQIMTWRELRETGEVPKFARFTQKDLRPFELPIPGLWKRITASDVTPGFSVARHDKKVPARTFVTGIREKGLPPNAIRSEDVRKHGIVTFKSAPVALVSLGGGVNAFSTETPLGIADFELTADGQIYDRASKSVWTLRGKAVSGPNFDELTPIAVSDEYWFSWKKFHPEAVLEDI